MLIGLRPWVRNGLGRDVPHQHTNLGIVIVMVMVIVIDSSHAFATETALEDQDTLRAGAAEGTSAAMRLQRSSFGDIARREHRLFFP